MISRTAISTNARPFSAFTSLSLLSVYGILVRVVIAGNPESAMVAREAELCLLVRDDEIPELVLCGEHIPEPEAVVEQAEDDADLPFVADVWRSFTFNSR